MEALKVLLGLFLIFAAGCQCEATFVLAPEISPARKPHTAAYRGGHVVKSPKPVRK